MNYTCGHIKVREPGQRGKLWSYCFDKAVWERVSNGLKVCSYHKEHIIKNDDEVVAFRELQ